MGSEMCIRDSNQVDRRITKVEESFTSGVFGNVSAAPLLVEQALIGESQSEQHNAEYETLSTAERPRPQIINTIPILDKDLRERSLYLFEKLKADGKSEQYDTVLMEATKILEEKLRHLTPDSKSIGLGLCRDVFSGEEPILKIGDDEATREAAHSLFRGVFGFVRNTTHHKFVSDLSSERVIQILGAIDYLISLINSGARGKKPS